MYFHEFTNCLKPAKDKGKNAWRYFVCIESGYCVDLGLLSLLYYTINNCHVMSRHVMSSRVMSC